MTCTKDEVAACIRAERARKGWTRDELAQETGIPYATLGSYENAECSIPLENAWKLADVFGLPIGALFGRDERAYSKAI